MKNAMPFIIAALVAGGVYLYMREKNRMPMTDNLLPSPQAFTEAPIFASDLPTAPGAATFDPNLLWT